MNHLPQFAAACRILRTLRAAGYEAYLAGGCVRDLLLGREPKDFDVATTARPEVVLEMFPRTFAVGAHFGVVLVASVDEEESQETNFVTEVATFRCDGSYSDGRRPDAVQYTLSAAEDVQRRDFTINGLLLDPLALHSAPLEQDRVPSSLVPSFPASSQEQTMIAHLDLQTSQLKSKAGPSLRSNQDDGSLERAENLADEERWSPERLLPHVFDRVGGVADLHAGVIRAIGRADLRLEEDHLRMLRGVRFAARLGFALEAETAAAIRRLATKTALVSRERVRDELTKMLTEGHARRAFELLDETGLLSEVLPEVARMKGVEQPPQFHPEGDVWTHTLKLLEQLEPGCPPSLAWGALLHDVGKPPTFRRAERIRFDGHVEVGVVIAAEICRRFRFSNDETCQILALVENHMRFMDAPRMKAATLKRFFRLNRFEEHLALHKMDCLASKGGLETWELVSERWQTMPQEIVRPQPLLTGRELIAAGYIPGAAFKAMLHAVEDAQLEGQIHSAAEALALVQERFGPASV